MRRFLTYPLIADYAGVLLKSVHRWQIRHKGVFPPPKTCPTCGYYPVIDKEALEVWLQETGRK